MDRNSAIGLTLIAALLMAYFYWFSPVPPPPTQQQEPSAAPSEMGRQDSTAEVTLPSDSTLAATFGDLSASMKGQESTTLIENEDVKFTFTNRGGILREVELKKYKTYLQQPLKLITPTNNEFNLMARYQGKDIDLYKLFYQVTQEKKGDTTEVQFLISLADGSSISQLYKIPSKGYEITYEINSTGFADSYRENMTFNGKTFETN